MDKKTFEALARLMNQLGEMEDGDAYLVMPFDGVPQNHSDFRKVAKWMDSKIIWTPVNK